MSYELIYKFNEKQHPKPIFERILFGTLHLKNFHRHKSLTSS